MPTPRARRASYSHKHTAEMCHLLRPHHRSGIRGRAEVDAAARERALLHPILHHRWRRRRPGCRDDARLGVAERAHRRVRRRVDRHGVKGAERHLGPGAAGRAPVQLDGLDAEVFVRADADRVERRCGEGARAKDARRGVGDRVESIPACFLRDGEIVFVRVCTHTHTLHTLPPQITHRQHTHTHTTEQQTHQLATLSQLTPLKDNEKSPPSSLSRPNSNEPVVGASIQPV